MNIYVGNLPYTVSESDLTDLFSPFGEVESAKLIIDRATGRSKGFGFVEMKNDNEAEEAMGALNDTDVGGRNIKVNQARPKEQRPRKQARY
jgi:RNA recognition motif-containing protein